MLHSVSINKIIPCTTDVDVINGYHHLRGGGGGAITLHLDDNHVGHVLVPATLKGGTQILRGIINLT